MATSFRNGANFATGGSTIRALNATFPRGGYSPFSLNIQIVHLARFKSRSIAIHTKGSGRGFRHHFPKAKDISEALYMLDIGQNDLATGFGSMRGVGQGFDYSSSCGPHHQRQVMKNCLKGSNISCGP